MLSIFSLIFRIILVKKICVLAKAFSWQMVDGWSPPMMARLEKKNFIGAVWRKRFCVNFVFSLSLSFLSLWLKLKFASHFLFNLDSFVKMYFSSLDIVLKSFKNWMWFILGFNEVYFLFSLNWLYFYILWEKVEFEFALWYSPIFVISFFTVYFNKI